MRQDPFEGKKPMINSMNIEPPHDLEGWGSEYRAGFEQGVEWAIVNLLNRTVKDNFAVGVSYENKERVIRFFSMRGRLTELLAESDESGKCILGVMSKDAMLEGLLKKP